MESLRIGTQVSCLSPIALDQVRELLNLSDQAMTKVRESRVLAALRFELMDERFHDVKEAHENTYCWIFESSPCGLDTPEDRNRLGPISLTPRLAHITRQSLRRYTAENGGGLFFFQDMAQGWTGNILHFRKTRSW